MEITDAFRFNEKRDFGQVINATFTFLRSHYKEIYKDLLIWAAPVYLMAAVLSASLQVNMLTQPKTNILQQYMSPSFLITIALTAIGHTIGLVVVANKIMNYHEAQRSGITYTTGEALKMNGGRIFLCYILYVILVAAGFLCLVIPGMYLAISLSLAPIALIFNRGMRVDRAMSESGRLVKNYWWRTFGVAFIMIIIIYMVTIVFTIPNLISMAVITLHTVKGEQQQGNFLLHTIFTCIAQLGQVVALPFYIISMAVQYFSLKEIKDEVTLKEKIEAI
jgi:hypothetical protein